MSSTEINTDIGGTLSDKLGDQIGTDRRAGTVTVFGRKFFVGDEAAKYVDGLVAQAQTAVSQYGGAYARRYGTELARLVVADHKAANVGKAAETLWRYGLPVADIGLGVKAAVKDGYTRINELRRESAAVLAANNDTKAGVGQVLTTKFSALANERALIFKEGRQTVVASITGVIRNLPNIIINVWQQKKEKIKGSAQALSSLKDTLPERFPAGPKERKAVGTPAEQAHVASERSRVAKEIINLRHTVNPDLAKRTTSASVAQGASRIKDVKQEDPIFNVVSRLYKPKTLKDLDDNLKLATAAPFLGGLLSQLASTDLEKNAGKLTAWRRIKQLENIIKEQEPSSGSEIEHLVREIFQQHVEDHKVKQQLAGNKFNHIVEEVSEALIQDKLHPQALVELLDDKKVIAFDDKGVTYGKPSVVKEHLAKLVTKYTAKVTQKEFYKDAPFTKEEAVEAFKGLSAEEKPFYTMLFQPGMLELAGADKNEVAANREMGKQSFSDDIAAALQNLVAAGRQDLRKQGVAKDAIDDLEAIERDFIAALNRGRAGDYVSQNLQETTDVVRNIALTAKDQPDFWQRYIQKDSSGQELESGISSQGRMPMDYANRGELGYDR